MKDYFKLLSLFLIIPLSSCGGSNQSSVSGDSSGSPASSEVSKELEYNDFFDDIFNSSENPGINGNNSMFNLGNTPVRENSPLQDKVYYFLGSSVTLGTGSTGVSFPEYISKRNGSYGYKEAVAGTTLAHQDNTSYVARLENFDTSSHIDGFICQLSTNDSGNPDNFGVISENFEISDLDYTTTFGAIEYIIAKVKKVWNCPIWFFTNSYFTNDNYQTMVDGLKQIVTKWNIGLIDLYSNTVFNDISHDNYKIFMYDSIHPKMAGYRHWWTPMFEKALMEGLGYTFKNIPTGNPYSH